jgi:MoaA/NifB/PqqE/SkfB family radical SAM enzyme
MRKVPLAQSLAIIRQGSLNWTAGRPIVVSFEVTDACTCYCLHCDHGGPRDESCNLKASDYRRYSEALKPCVVQVSGGEPLLRADLTDVVRSIKRADGLPYIILVSTWSLMTEEKYLELRDAGVDQFSVSLDFPDGRHDNFRSYPGLFAHLDNIVPRLARLGHDDIVLNTCITSANVRDINANADQARKWGVNICYSAYSPRRTGDWGYFLQTAEELAVLRREFAQLESRRNGDNWIVSAPATLEQTRSYFERRGAEGCKAGLRFLVVTSDGMLQPCSMQFERYPLEQQDRMVNEFTKQNRCDECYVAIRSNLDKSFPQLLAENVRRYFSFGAAGDR